MGDWLRITHDCTFEGLPAEMTAAINKHVELYHLGFAPSQAAACIETTSKKAKKGVLERGDQSVQTGLLLASGWLLWAIRADDPEITVMSARLTDITVQDYAVTPLARLVPDSGIEITGSFTDVAQRGSSFIGLDAGPAAREFRQRLVDAVEAAKK